MYRSAAAAALAAQAAQTRALREALEEIKFQCDGKAYLIAKRALTGP